jgi:hypothetical protein
MRRFERLRDLFCDAECFVERNGAARNALREVLALDEFHHQRTNTVRFFQAVDVRDVRVVE